MGTFRGLMMAVLFIGFPGLVALVAPVSYSQEPHGPAAESQPVNIDTHMHLDGIIRARGQAPRRSAAATRSRAGRVIGKDQQSAAENLIGQMDRQGVRRAVIVVVPTHAGQRAEQDFEDVRQIVKRYPDRLSFVGGGSTLGSMLRGTDPAQVTTAVKTDFEAKAEAILAAGAVGFGEMLALHLSLSQHHSYYETVPDHPLFLLLADIAARHDVPIDLHMEAVVEEMATPKGLDRLPNNPVRLQPVIPAFERLLGHNRKARIVWQHIGWDNTGGMTVALLRRLLTAHPNLYLALRVEERPRTIGGDPMPNRIVDSRWRVKKEWLDLIGDFPDRFMIGSDEFMGIPGKSRRWPQSFEETWPIVAQLPGELRDKVGYRNAAQVYRLD